MKSYRVFRIFSLLILAGHCGLASASREPGEEIIVPRSNISISIDGKLSEKPWINATWRDLTLSDRRREPRIPAQVAFLFDSENLYVALKAREPDPEHVRLSEIARLEGAKLWQGDVVEWFVQPETDGPYVQLVWNPADVRLQFRCQAPGQLEQVNDLPWEVKTTFTDKEWISEAAISFSALKTKAPKEGDAWYVNVIRQRPDKSAPEIAALSPAGRNHHDPERFQQIWFEKAGIVKKYPKAGTGPIRALIGCFGAESGYDVIIQARSQLTRALGAENVDIRTIFDDSMKGWPRSLEELQQYSFIVLTGIPSSSFTAGQMETLRQYVEFGGHILLAGPTAHKGDETWQKSALGDAIPETSEIVRARRPIVIREAQDSLFADYPAEGPLTVWGMKSTLLPGAIALATLPGSPGEKEWPFLSEKVAGEGSVMHLNAAYSAGSTIAPTEELLWGNDFCRSSFYPIFWDNLIRRWTGKDPLHPAAAKGKTSPERETDRSSASPDHQELLTLRILEHNDGDVFSPGGRMTLRPLKKKDDHYPYEIAFSIIPQTGTPISLGKRTITAADDPVSLTLPDLDAGVYALEGMLIREGRELDRARERFVVAFPPTEKDEFPIGVIIESMLEQDDLERIAGNLKASGFNMATYLGGIVADGYANQYRSHLEIVFNSRMQEAGIRTWPNWYPMLYYFLMPDGRGNYNYTQHTPQAPDWAFPGSNFLPWQSYWLGWFERRFGHMPLTTGMVIGDEITSTMLPVSPDLLKGFTEMTGSPAPSPEEIQRNQNLAFVRYRNKALNDAVWLTRRTTAAFNASWKLASVITPNCFGGHSTCLIDIPGQASGIETVSVDEYRYGEPKFYQKNLKSLAILWSASDFGRLANIGLCAGNLVNNFYMDYPEQMFAGLSAGIHWLEIFSFRSASFEKNGGQDEKFAKIAERTNKEGGRIGRMLNHYDRARARAAILYPDTAHLWLAAGKELNQDYLAMTGKSAQYLDLGYAFETGFDIGRRMFGHFDVVFDEQSRRGELKNYDVLVLAYSKQTDEATLRALRRFVEQGGTLLVSTDSGLLNEAGKPTDVLARIFPAAIGPARNAPADYSETRMQDKAAWSRGNDLMPRQDAEVLFSFPDGKPACVRGPVGRGEVILLGMPLAALQGSSGADRFKLLEYLLNQRARLVSKPTDGEFSAITFRAQRDHQRVFMIANHNKAMAETEVLAESDESEKSNTLVDIVTGERLPFEVAEGTLRFRVKCPDRWGRALAFLDEPPAQVEVSVAARKISQGEPFWLLVRLLRRDGLLLNATLPFDIEVRDPSGAIRADLSGVRVAENGVWALHRNWPVAAQPGKWTAHVSEPISKTSVSVDWEAR